MRLLRAIEVIVNWTAIVLFAVMFILVVMQIAMRSLFNAPLIWSEELARYLFVWVSFLGWIIASRRHSHLGVDILLPRLSPLLRRFFNGGIALATLLFAGILLWTGGLVVERNSDIETVTLFFTFGFVYAVVPAAAVLIAIYALRDLVVAIRGGDVGQAGQVQL